MSDRPIDQWLAEHENALIAFRRHLHAHPELSHEEHLTTSAIAERLDAAGVPHRRLSVGTGVIADLDPSGVEPADLERSGRLALRADIDALAMDDRKDVPYRSQVDGVAHACGHDVHTTVVLGAALFFARHPDELPGPVRLVFQPAEEHVRGGAVDVLADGGLDGVDAMVGVHCWPKFDAGEIGLRDGAITSAADMSVVTLSGPGGHTARPDETVDLITVAARVVSELPTVLSELASAEVRYVFGSVQAGNASNVIPSRCVLKASVRTPSLEVWETLPSLVDKALQRVLAGTGAEFELEYTSGVPPVVNDVGVTDTVRRAAADEFGGDAVREAERSWGGDDFAWFAREVPATYLRLGTHDPSQARRHDLHVGDFDVDERSIAAGVRVLVATVQQHFAARRASS